jgi:hypothetical protein
MGKGGRQGYVMVLAELRDLGEARRFVLQGLWLQRVARTTGGRVKTVLEWALEIASNGHPLPPVGFIADLGHLAYGFDQTGEGKEPVHVPGWPATLARSYEDHVLGKVYADWTFERATDALRRYQGRDRAKGLAYVTKQFRDRAGLGGVELSPAVLRGMLTSNPDDLLAQGFDALSADGPLPLLVHQYEELVSAARKVAEVLGPEDVIALEQRTALADMGQYVAHRQILQVTAKMEARLPHRPVRPLAGRKEVPTRVLDEDQYPVGGYSSISTRGSVESLLHSQLAYMEDEKPDLFDVKFVRDELFYYSRDENQFLRRRRAFVFVVRPEAVSARFKDAELPTQRIVMVAALLLALVRRLAEWLSTDALRFEFLFVRAGERRPLAEEEELFAILLRELIERGVAVVEHPANLGDVSAHCEQVARTSQVQVLVVGPEPVLFEPEGAVVTQLSVNGPRPRLTDGSGVPAEFGGDDPFEQWIEAVVRVLKLWV